MFKILATPREILCSTRCGLGAICKRWERWSLVWHGVPLVTKTELKNWMLEQLVKSNGCSSIQFYGSFIKFLGGQISSTSWNFGVELLIFLSSESYVLKYKKNIRVGSSISGNIWKFRFTRVLNIPLLKHKKSSVMPGF